MAQIIRTIAVIASCCFCAGMIYFSSTGTNNNAVYICMVGCLVSFMINAAAAARINRKAVEEAAKKNAEAAAE